MTLGNINRPVAASAAPVAAVNDPQATPIHTRLDTKGDSSSAARADALGLLGALEAGVVTFPANLAGSTLGTGGFLAGGAFGGEDEAVVPALGFAPDD